MHVYILLNSYFVTLPISTPPTYETVMSVIENTFLNQNRSGRSLRPPHWKEAAILFNATRSYVRVLKEYPEAFLDPLGNRVSDGCGRMRCLRWSEDLFSTVKDAADGDANNEDSNCEGGLKKKQKVVRLSLDGEIETRLETGHLSAAKSRTDRPQNWREVAQFFITCKKFLLVKLEFPNAFLNSDGEPATDSCAKMRVLRWKDDYNIELLEGRSSDGSSVVYGGEIDKKIAAAYKDLIDQGMIVDEATLQQLLLEELRRANVMNLHVSEGGMNTFGKVWAGRFFKRHKFTVPSKIGSSSSSSSSTGAIKHIFQNNDIPVSNTQEPIAVDNAVKDENKIIMTSSASASSSSSSNNSNNNSTSVFDENIPSTLSIERVAFQIDIAGRTECWRDVAQLFMVCGNYKTVKDQFPDVFLDQKRQPISDGSGKMQCQQWKEDLIVERQELGRSV